MCWVTIKPTKVTTVTLRIRRAEHYCFGDLIADMRLEMPEVEEQLREVIRNLCGGDEGLGVNTSKLMPMFNGDEESVLTSLPPKAQHLITYLVKREMRESSNSIECKFSVPVDFTLDDLKKIVRNEINHSELVSIYDYIYAPVFRASYSGHGLICTIYVAVNNLKSDQQIFNLITENSRNIVSALNQISVADWF